MRGVRVEPTRQAERYAPVLTPTTHERGAERHGIGHIAALDGVRGLAIVMVMSFHIGLGLKPVNSIDSIVHQLTGLGIHGVDLFFVLSGFLITGILVDAKGSQAYFRTFYIRRSLRIFPLYYLMLAILFVAVPLIFHPGSAAYRQLEASQGWYWGYVVNLLVALHGLGAAPLNTAHFWSLAVEEQFYLIWPPIVALCPVKRLRAVCLGAVVTSFVMRCVVVAANARFMTEIVHHFTLARMDGLALGGLIAIVLREDGGRDSIKRWSLPVLVMAVGAFAAVLVGDHFFFPQTHVLNLTIGFTVKAALLAGLIMVVLSAPARGFVHTFFSSRVMRAFGRYSYGLYVYHFPLILVLATFVFPHDMPVILGSALPAIVGFALCAFALSGFVAWLSFTYFEAPILRLKHRFEMKPA